MLLTVSLPPAIAVSLLLVVALRVSPAASAQAPIGLAGDTFFGGIQVNEPDHDRWAAAIRAAGLDSIQVTIYGRQRAWDGAELAFDAESPWVVSEIRAAQGAGLKTVLVMRLALEHGRVENRHLWHGMIWPREEIMEDWFARYREFVLQGAALAAREQVSLFVIGNELSSLTSTTPLTVLPDLYAYYIDPERVASVRGDLTQCADQISRGGTVDDLRQLDGGRYRTLEQMLLDQERVHREWVLSITGNPPDVLRLNARRERYDRFWRDLIRDVRRSYDGPVTYGANFDQFDQVGFWDATDALATTAYFPLGPLALDPEDRRSRMVESWRRVIDRIEAVTGADGADPLPTLLLELGWTRRRGATVRPYSYGVLEVLETVGSSREPPYPLTCVHWATQPFEPAERVDAMAALADVVTAGGFLTLHGFTLWKLTTRPQHRGIEPFAVVLEPSGAESRGAVAAPSAEASDAAAFRADQEYMGQAARIARTVTDRLRRWHNGRDAIPDGK